MEFRSYALIQLAIVVALGSISIAMIHTRPMNTYETTVRDLLAEIWVASNTPGYRRTLVLYLSRPLTLNNGTIILSQEFWVLGPFNQSGRFLRVPIVVEESIVLEGLVVLEIEGSSTGVVIVKRVTIG